MSEEQSGEAQSNEVRSAEYFKEILKQMSYEEWRKQKLRNKHEFLTDPQAIIWNYIDEKGKVYLSDKDYLKVSSSDEILRLIEKRQDSLYKTIKRRQVVDPRSSDWAKFTDKINSTNRDIAALHDRLDSMHRW
jgi:hypothetical protein